MSQPPDATVRLADGVTREYLLHHRVCPWRMDAGGEVIVVAAAPDARTENCAGELAAVYECAVTFEVLPAPDVERLIERLCSSAEREVELSLVHAGVGARESEHDAAPDGMGPTDVRDLANQPPVVRYLNMLVRDAYDASASDIHLEVSGTGLTPRFRLDGVLTAAPEPPPSLAHAVISRIKLLAELSIAERRRPQDGRIRVRLETRELDLRVSTVPTAHGESVVLRLLERGGRPIAMEDLGMPTSLLRQMREIALRPHGLVLVTGPTGSGKTTTLYACLGCRDARTEKIITIEDPIEYELLGITQMPVHAQAGVTFAAALRSILRQDPDVVMVGEMRDSETAAVAVQAAMTGHLVFSTLHTNDAIGAVPRLIDLGVPPYLIAGTLECVLAQRLVRRVCPNCRIACQPPFAELAALSGLDPDEIEHQYVAGALNPMRGAGCESCRGTGYRGRTGVYELLRVTDELRQVIARSSSRPELREAAARAGAEGIRVDAWNKVRAGITTVEEVLRVVQS